MMRCVSFTFNFFACLSGDIGFDAIVLPEAHNELQLYAGSVREPNPANASLLSLSPSESSSSGNAEAREEVPMEVDAIATVKSPEQSRLLLSTTVLDGAPNDADDVYDYGTLFSVYFASSPAIYYCYRVRQKSNPLGKVDISGIMVNFFAKFTVFSEEDSGHISCKFHCNIWLHS